MTDREVVSTPNAPAAIGPYNQAIRAGDLVFSAGQGGFDPATRTVVPGGTTAEAAQVIRNLAAILEAAGSGLDLVVRVGVYLADMADFAAVNEVYARHFMEPYPARTTIAVRELPAGLRIEMDCVALVRSS